MKILDSNILIYSFSDAFRFLREMIWSDAVFVSEISRLEVLGFHGISADEEQYFNDIFNIIGVHEIDSAVLDMAIVLRKTYKMKACDSIVAGTALVHGGTLYTRNLTDFAKIEGLRLIDPVLS